MLMDLELSETQAMFKDSLQGLLGHEVTYDRIRELQANATVDEDLWMRLAEAGWLSLPFSELIDSRVGLPDVAIAVEEIAKSAAVIPFVETMACALAVSHAGTETAREILTAAVPSGAMKVAAAFIEDVNATSQTSTIVCDGHLVGHKKFIDYGQSCSHHLVHAVENGEAGLFLVPAEPPGVRLERLSNIGRTPQAKATYHGAAAVRAGGPDCYLRLVQVGTLLCSVQLLGYAQVALDLTVEYVKVREQFGRPLGSFQAVQHHCADMATAVEATRFLVYECAWKLDRGEATVEDIAVAKAAASRTGVYVTSQAHQLHGGIGVTEEYPLQFYSRRAKERSVAWGSEHASILEIARTVDDPGSWL
jgi:alkylation response protein AidB-like acyl-CoA dehydrogenase